MNFASAWISGLVMAALASVAAQAEDGIAVPAGPVKLIASFAAPEGKGPFPTAVIIAGAGPAMRDGTAVMTAALNAKGIAVVRFDKRGCGDSTGNIATASLFDVIDDARAVVAYVKTRPDVDRKHIALIGLSQGGVIAPAIAVKDGGIAGLVLLGPPAMPLEQLSMLQWEIVVRAQGADDAFVAQGRATFLRLLTDLSTVKSDDEALAIAKPVLADAVAKGLIPQSQVDPILEGFATKAAREAQTYDPAVVLRQVRIPVLALTGTLDKQVPADPNLAILRKALADDRDVTVEEVPGLNHIFQVAKTGMADEWGQLNQPAYANPGMLETVTGWLAQRLD